MSAASKEKIELSGMSLISAMSGLVLRALVAKAFGQKMRVFYEGQSQSVAKKIARYQMEGKEGKAVNATVVKLAVDSIRAGLTSWSEPEMGTRLSQEALSDAIALCDRAQTRVGEKANIEDGLSGVIAALDGSRSLADGMARAMQTLGGKGGMMKSLSRVVAARALSGKATGLALAGDPSWREWSEAERRLSASDPEEKLARALLTRWVAEVSGPNENGSPARAMADDALAFYESEGAVSFKKARAKLAKGDQKMVALEEETSLSYKDFASALDEAMGIVESRLEQKAAGSGLGAKLLERRELEKASASAAPSAPKPPPKAL